jgi:hypothetical protein
MLRTGATIAGYRIEGVLGTGGMGVVYEATQLSLDRPVALKVIAPHLGADAAFRERFRREAMLQAALDHPHIVTVYEAGESDEGLFLAMRLVRGPSLKDLVLEGGLEPARAVSILAQAASALDAAHEAGLIHRDVKPQNILVDERDEHAYLADFGLIKSSAQRGLTGTGQYLGSLDYVSPEQIRGEPVSALSDVYAFAAVLYECLSGEVPFPRDTEAALLYAHLSEPPPRLTERRAELPDVLDAVIARGLAKQPAERHRSASQLVADAAAALDPDSSSSPSLGSSLVVESDNSTLPGIPPPTNGDARLRFGQTIVDPALLRETPRIELEPERRLTRTWIAGLVALVLALAAAGFLLGRSRDRIDRPATGVAVGGPLTLQFPNAEWRPARRAPRLAGLALSSPIALTSSVAASPGDLVAGVAAAAEGPLLLPPALLAELPKRPQPRGEPVRLGRLDALRYRGLRHRRVGAALTLYVVPTDGGAATVACLGGEAEAAAGVERTALRRCEEVATTLALRGAKAVPLGPNPRHTVALRRTLARLNARRTRERRALRAARTQVAQAGAAERLAAAYGAAAKALAKTRPGLVERPAHRALVAALARARAAHGTLALGARTGSRPVYRRGALAVRRAEAAADRAARSLGL